MRETDTPDTLVAPPEAAPQDAHAAAPASRDSVRALYGQPDPRVYAKQLARLDAHARRFIELSPFLVMASADADGNCDATPRGDAPGFVAIPDDTTLLIPDRIGNRRVDTLLNVASNPRLGLIFFVPGINESLRVNGRAELATDPALLEPLAAQGKTPKSALLLRVEEVFFHCGKALIRSRLWAPESQVERGSFPSLGRIMADQIDGGANADQAERWINESYRDRLY